MEIKEKQVEDGSIPKVIHVVGGQWQQESDSWKTLNPEYTLEFYDDDRCIAFIRQHYPQYEFAYSHRLKSVRRFDFIRYLIVHHYGGIYVGPQVGMSPILVWGLPDLEY
jgi:mannosyltransferase OCH1-like enzyme